MLSATMQTFMTPVTTGMVDVWWNVLAPEEFSLVRRAMSDYLKDPADGKWPPKPAEILARINAFAKPYVPRIEHKRQAPAESVLQRIRDMTKRHLPGPFWTVDRIENHHQVRFVVTQAQNFGPISAAGRFLDECKRAGVITADNCLGVRCTREPGEDPIEEEIMEEPV